MPDIFLSYSREDQARATLFAEAFQTQGFDVWWDVGLRTGEAYDEVTETALRTAKAVMVPRMTEPCERPIMFELTQTEHLIDAWNATPLETGA